MKRTLCLAAILALSLGVAACRSAGAPIGPSATVTTEKVVQATVPPATPTPLPPTPTPLPATPTPAPTATPTPAPLTLEALKNAEYPSEFTASKKARLVDGKYEEPAAPGSASKVVVALQPAHALGDLNGDGAGDAAAILVQSGGGSGTFYYLVAVLNEGGSPRAVATVSLGDRTKVDRVAIQSGAIIVDLVAHGPNDPLCCPTQKATRTYRLQGGSLATTDASAAPGSPTATSPIVDVVWQWERFADTAQKNDITVTDPSKYTLRLLPDGTYQVRADCNTGSGKYTLAGSNLKLEAGVTTLIACPAGSLSDKYLARLAEVVSYVVQDGKLVANLKMDAGSLIFRNASAP